MVSERNSKKTTELTNILLTIRDHNNSIKQKLAKDKINKRERSETMKFLSIDMNIKKYYLLSKLTYLRAFDKSIKL